MAETVVTMSTTARQARAGDQPTIEATETTTVRSINGRDLGVIRDFLVACDAARLPGWVRVECRHADNGHLAGLSLRYSRDLEQAADEAEGEAAE